MRAATTTVPVPARDPEPAGGRSWSAGVERLPACAEHASIMRAEVAERWGAPPLDPSGTHEPNSSADVVARSVPSAVLLEARSDAVREWLNQRTLARRWQWTALGVAVDWRLAGSLIQELRAAGFTVEDRRE